MKEINEVFVLVHMYPTTGLNILAAHTTYELAARNKENYIMEKVDDHRFNLAEFGDMTENDLEESVDNFQADLEDLVYIRPTGLIGE